MDTRGKSIIAALALLCAGAQADDLGRLFSTPRERAELDRPPGVREAPRRKAIRVQGVITRAGREPMVWVDDRPMARGDAGNGFVLLDVGREGALILRDTVPPSPNEDALRAADPGETP